MVGVLVEAMARVLPAALVFASVACGDHVIVGSEEKTPRLPADVGPAPEECSRPGLVPGGRVWLARGVIVANDGSLLTIGCNELAGATEDAHLVHPFRVEDVFVDTYEITNACFSSCLQTGACDEPLSADLEPSWDSPEVADHPVRVRPDTAGQFCSWRGGRLPTRLELTRASHGAKRHVANPELFDWVIACKDDQVADPESCEILSYMQWVESMPVGTFERDRGPFGHRGLFGGISDITASVTVAPSELCSYPVGDPDPGGFGDDWGQRFHFNPRISDAIS